MKPTMVLAMAGAVALVACQQAKSEEVGTDVCKTGLMWAGGDSESPEMHPGRSCITCHAQEGEGPSFIAAGTVFPDYREADDCYGVEGITVELTDASGAVYTTVTNAAGNFFLESEEVSMVMPYTARLTFEGRERRMDAEQASGDCSSCHTQSGANQAPGRILAP
jgi:hypothetical protein